MVENGLLKGETSMKKIITRILAVIIAISAIGTIELTAAESTPTATTTSQDTTRRRTRVMNRWQQRRARRSNPRARRTNRPRRRPVKPQPQPEATPEAKKQLATTNKDLKVETKNLQTQLAKAAKATTPVEKKVAQEDAYKAAQTLLTSLKGERTLMNDVYSGYDTTQINTARAQLLKLEQMKTKLVEELAKKQAAIDPLTDKGYIWNAAKPGKETEYNKLSLEITKLQNILARIDASISDQNIIAGDEWSKAYKALLVSGIIAPAVLAADYALTGGATTMAIAGKARTLAGSVGSGAVAAKDWAVGKASAAKDWITNKTPEVPAPLKGVAAVGGSIAGMVATQIAMQKAMQAANAAINYLSQSISDEEAKPAPNQNKVASDRQELVKAQAEKARLEKELAELKRQNPQ